MHLALCNAFLECCSSKCNIKTKLQYKNTITTTQYIHSQEFASMVQICTSLFKSIQILLCKTKCNTITLLQLENVYTIYSFLYFILGRHHLFIAWGVRLLIFSLFFSLYQHFCWSCTSKVLLLVSQFVFFSF